MTADQKTGARRASARVVRRVRVRRCRIQMRTRPKERVSLVSPASPASPSSAGPHQPCSPESSPASMRSSSSRLTHLTRYTTRSSPGLTTTDDTHARTSFCRHAVLRPRPSGHAVVCCVVPRARACGGHSSGAAGMRSGCHGSSARANVLCSICVRVRARVRV